MFRENPPPPFFGHPLLHHAAFSGSSDHWLNIVLGLAALATLAGFAAGAIFTGRYGRRASVSLSAKATPVPGGYLIVARPSVKAVGVFRVKFTKGEEGSQLQVTQVFIDAEWQPVRVPDERRSNLFGDSFVEGGEELTTTTVIAVPKPPASVIGWFLWLQVCAPNRFLRLDWVRRGLRWPPIRWVVGWRSFRKLRAKIPAPIRRYVRRILNGWQWTDQIFVPLPEGHNYADAQREDL
jgi:hypothetical protein